MLRDRFVLVASLVLLAVAVTAFWPAFDSGFIILDDEQYVTKNPNVLSGLNTSGLVTDFKTFNAGNWHPLTWLSLQADSSLFGAGPAGFHRTNILLHACNAVILFLFLCRATGRKWPAVIVASLFAVHPMRAESVVWVAERKDVLSSFFGLLALLAYTNYVAKTSIRQYLVVLTFFVLSLLAKPMWVTLPFLLLLLDWWPLNRFDSKKPGSAWLLLREKLPLIALSVASSVITWLAQRAVAVSSLHHVPIELRLSNAVTSYCAYLFQTIWPVDLAPLYLLGAQSQDLILVSFYAVVLLSVTVIAVYERKALPFLLVGWLWYLGTLVPVIGLVQVGRQARADRYSYLPMIGIYVAVVWGFDQLASRYRKQTAAIGLAVATIVVLAFLCQKQSSYWHDDITLWTHTLEVTGPNWWASYCRGVVEEKQGKSDAAFQDYTEAVASEPNEPDPRSKLGLALLARDQKEDALACLEEGISKNPRDAKLRYSLGVYYQSQKMLNEARACYEQALQLDPGLPEAHANLGSVMRTLGKNQVAIDHLREAVRLDPANDIAWFNLGAAQEMEGNLDEAIAAYSRAAELVPRSTLYPPARDRALQRRRSGS
jgi:tetratricopeptide (TPR) repeat protein